MNMQELSLRMSPEGFMSKIEELQAITSSRKQ